MQLVNRFYPSIPIYNFPNLDKNLNEKFDIVVDDYGISSDFYETNTSRTPRGILASRCAFRDIYYYISLLYDNDPKEVIDIGCGENSFKDFFPSITGMDIANTRADIISKFDEVFVVSNKSKYDAAISINSVHFTSWYLLKKNIDLLLNLVKLNGRILCTVCFFALDKYSSVDQGSTNITIMDKVKRVYDIILTTGNKIIMFDTPHDKHLNFNLGSINGDVRFILEKTNE